VRLRRFNHASLDDQLGRVSSELKADTNKYEVKFVDSEKKFNCKPENVVHACTSCHVVLGGEGAPTSCTCTTCGVARYCKTSCRTSYVARHKGKE